MKLLAWIKIDGAAYVTSVAGRNGAVTLTFSDIGGTLSIAAGGTGQATAALARGSSGIGAAPGSISGSTGTSSIGSTSIPLKFNCTLGDGSHTSFTITHNLGTVAILIVVRDASGNGVITDSQVTDSNNVVVSFASAPSSNSYIVTILG